MLVLLSGFICKEEEMDPKGFIMLSVYNCTQKEFFNMLRIILVFSKVNIS